MNIVIKGNTGIVRLGDGASSDLKDASTQGGQFEQLKLLQLMKEHNKIKSNPDPMSQIKEFAELGKTLSELKSDNPVTQKKYEQIATLCHMDIVRTLGVAQTQVMQNPQENASQVEALNKIHRATLASSPEEFFSQVVNAFREGNFPSVSTPVNVPVNVEENEQSKPCEQRSFCTNEQPKNANSSVNNEEKKPFSPSPFCSYGH